MTCYYSEGESAEATPAGAQSGVQNVLILKVFTRPNCAKFDTARLLVLSDKFDKCEVDLINSS